MVRLSPFWRLPWDVAGGACRFTKEGVLDNTAPRQYICTQGGDRICDRYRKFYESVRESCLGPYSSVFFPRLDASIAIPPPERRCYEKRSCLWATCIGYYPGAVPFNEHLVSCSLSISPARGTTQEPTEVPDNAVTLLCSLATTQHIQDLYCRPGTSHRSFSRQLWGLIKLGSEWTGEPDLLGLDPQHAKTS